MTDVDKINQVRDPRMSDSSQRTNDKGFQQIFEGKLLQNCHVVTFPYRDPATEMLDQTEKVLDLLDDYVQQLNDPAVTLKEIAPITDRIETEMRMIESKTACIVPRNEDIEQFIRDLSMTAKVAVLKFRRGDYV